MKSVAKIFAIGLGLTVALSEFNVAEAVTFKAAPVATEQGNVVQVQRRRIRRGPGRGIRRGRNNGAAIAGAIIGGAIIAGAIANERRREARRVYRGDAHENWCYSRYRSYRAWDNTYQPYSGPRRYCRSPYG